jgi:hypothetical protein
MDFIVGLSHTSRGYNSIWVIVDRLSKTAHYIPVSTICRVIQYAQLYVSHIVRYHDIPKTIIFVEDVSLLLAFGSNCMSVWAPTSSESQLIIPKLTERLNESIKRACVPTDGPKWDKYLPLAEFSYNNSYQESIKMSPF